MKLIYSFLLFSIIFTINAQRGLFNQSYEAMAKDFNIKESQLQKHKSQGRVVIYNEKKHKTRLARTQLKTKKGKTKTIDKGFYKTQYETLSKQSITHYRVRYIFVDKTKFELEEDYRAYILRIKKLLNHNAFESVAMQYSMDFRKNNGGDSGWFKKGKTHPIFFKEATNTAKLADEVFEFEIPEINAYYFVKKTHAKKDIREVMVLQTKKKK